MKTVVSLTIGFAIAAIGMDTVSGRSASPWASTSWSRA